MVSCSCTQGQGWILHVVVLVLGDANIVSIQFDKERGLHPSRSVTVYKHAYETQRTRHRRIADRHVRIVTSKMSCAQKTRESCERLSPKQTKGKRRWNLNSSVI